MIKMFDNFTIVKFTIIMILYLIYFVHWKMYEKKRNTP